MAVSLQNRILARDVIGTLKTLDGTAMGEFLCIGSIPCSLLQPSILFIPQSIAGMDFPDLSIDLTFNTSSPTQTVMVPILNDMAVEDFEYFSLALVSNDPAVTLNPSTANITLVDDTDSELHPPDT